MKKLIFSFVLIFSLAANAQVNFKPEAPLPLDPAVRYGTLPNGMKYYVRKNAKPEKRAELRLAVNAGSTAENDDQQGLAHFVEHMAFNGSKNFKKNELVDYLESVGTKFGPHLNAYTSFDETVYMLQIPTDKQEIIDKGLLILEDWAHNLAFDEKEIDKERGVVTEEWRLGQGADERMRRKYWPTLFKDSRYAVRLPIGQKDILQTCKYETLKQFYYDWYRPELMAVIAVGDFDLDKMEAQIKKQFGAIPSKQNPRELKSWPVPDQKTQDIVITSDKEASYTAVQIMYRHPAENLITHNDYRNMLIERLYNGMINNRLQELQKQMNPPFAYGYSYFGGFVRNKNFYNSVAVVQDGGIEKGLRALILENERAKQFGFTTSEFERQKKQLLREYESMFNERDKNESASFTYEYVSHHLEGDAAPGIAYEYELCKALTPGINLDEVNALPKKWITDGTNSMIIITAPEKEGMKLPSEEEIRTAYKSAQAEKVSAYVDNVSTKPLLEKTESTGKVVSEKQIKEYGVTEWTLSNGARIILKPTDFKNDEIVFNSYSFGGTSLYENKDFMSADYSNLIVSESGFGEFNRTSLDKLLQDKVVNVSASVGEITEGIAGSFSPQDIETAFQLIYLNFRGARKDSVAFVALKEQEKSFLQNKFSSPEQIFFDTLQYAMSNYNFRSRPSSIEILEEVKLSRALAIYNERFADPGDFTFVFVGAFKLETIKPMIEKYIGGLASTNKKETFRDLGIVPPKGTINKTVKKGTEPKARVSMIFNGPFEYTRKNRVEMNALVKLLNIKLRENLREDKGGVYGVGLNPSLVKYPKQGYKLTIGFGCAPENVETLISAALSEIEGVKANGCDEKNLIKVKETFIREYETSLKENRFWLNTIMSNDMNKENLLELNDYINYVNALKSEDFKRLANQYFNMAEYKRFVLLPEN